MESQLEEEFKSLNNFISKEIDAQLQKAGRLLNEAIELSKKYGVPFRSGLSPLHQTYVPESFKERFGSLSQETIDELMDMGIDIDQYGWERSQVC